MSSVIAMIYHGEMCLASDKKSTDHETGYESEPETKQIVINDEIAIGFTGSGNIAKVIMKTLRHPKNTEKISQMTFANAPLFLDDIYQSHIAITQYPDEETRHVSALIIGLNKDKPEIVQWDSIRGIEIAEQKHPDNFTAVPLSPYDMSGAECARILLESAEKNARYNSLEKIAIDYFKVVSSISKYVSETATIWSKHYITP